MVSGGVCDIGYTFTPTAIGPAPAGQSNLPSNSYNTQQTVLFSTSGSGGYSTVPLPFTLLAETEVYGYSFSESFTFTGAFPASGTMVFYIGAQTLCMAPITNASAGTITCNAAASGLAFGSYTVSFTFTSTNSFYSSVTGTTTLNVTKAPLTVTVNSFTRQYGTPNPTFTGTITGAVNSDVINATYSTTATSLSPVGTYVINATLTPVGSANLSNYAPPVRQPDQHRSFRSGGAVSETGAFVREISGELGLFATTGFQEDSGPEERVFNEEQFIAQAQSVLEERLRLLDYAMAHYDDGVLFFYFSSTDLQAHMLWWDSDQKHPTKSEAQVQSGFGHVRRLYQKLDAVVGEILARYDRRADGDRDERSRLRQFRAAIQSQFLAPRPGLSRPARLHFDHGRRRLDANPGLRAGNQRTVPQSPRAGKGWDCRTGRKGGAAGRIGDPAGGRAGRRRQPRDPPRVPRGPDRLRATPPPCARLDRGLSAQLPGIVGDVPRRADRAGLDGQRFCLERGSTADAGEVPGVLFSNRPLQAQAPSLVDMAPSILAEFGLPVPSSMEGKKRFCRAGSKGMKNVHGTGLRNIGLMGTNCRWWNGQILFRG